MSVLVMRPVERAFADAQSGTPVLFATTDDNLDGE
jgi:hypothetical protein